MSTHFIGLTTTKFGTIADLEKSTDIEPQHIAEAIQYRSLDREMMS